MSSVSISQTAVGSFQGAISSSLVSYRKPDQLPIILFSLLLALPLPTSNSLEVWVIEEFILYNVSPTQTMPSLEAKNSKLNAKCANIRTIF